MWWFTVPCPIIGCVLLITIIGVPLFSLSGLMDFWISLQVSALFLLFFFIQMLFFIFFVCFLNAFDKHKQPEK